MHKRNSAHWQEGQEAEKEKRRLIAAVGALSVLKDRLYFASKTGSASSS